ncbi:MAG: AAA family ATPase [Negativicutes bacterium]|nr:AAA family ATPase [Negativicutes bacterium]
MATMRKATRTKAKLRLGISGPAGGGKTFGSLLVAFGITGDWNKICVIDTENHSGELYANYTLNGIEIGEFNYIEISSPFTPEKYIAAIHEAEAAGIEVAIIDSLTHAWSGEGGLLDKKGQIEKSGKAGVNSWTAWRDITPMHNRLVESILQSKIHIIATLRAKMETIQEKDDSGKTVVRKLGLNPIQRDGMEYEFTTFIDIDQNHQATTSKDRTSLLDGKVFCLGVETGRLLLSWLETGVDIPANYYQQPQPAQPFQPSFNPLVPQPQFVQPAMPFEQPAAPIVPAAPVYGFPAHEQDIVSVWNNAGWPEGGIIGWVQERYKRAPAELTAAECYEIYILFTSYVQEKMGGQ